MRGLLAEFTDGTFPGLDAWRRFHATGEVPDEVTAVIELKGGNAKIPDQTTPAGCGNTGGRGRQPQADPASRGTRGPTIKRNRVFSSRAGSSRSVTVGDSHEFHRLRHRGA